MEPQAKELLTVEEPVSVTFSDGRTATGILWMNASRRGPWVVEYDGRRASDGRTYQTAEIRAVARAQLREMARRS